MCLAQPSENAFERMHYGRLVVVSKFIAAYCAVIMALVVDMPLALSADYLDSRISLYQTHQYRLAKKSLLAAIGMHPTDARAHYYLANTLVKLNDHRLAQEHFQMASILDPDGTYGKFATQALDGYRHASRAIPTNDKVPGFAQQNASVLTDAPQLFYSQERSMLYQHGIWQKNDGSGPIDSTLPSHTNNAHFSRHSSAPGKHDDESSH